MFFLKFDFLKVFWKFINLTLETKSKGTTFILNKINHQSLVLYGDFDKTHRSIEKLNF